MTKLLYAGPPWQVLHDDYAKKGRIDADAPVTASYEVDIRAPRDRVWELLASPLGWETFDPAIHDVRVDGQVAADTPFTWANGRARMKSRFAVVDPGRELTWTGVSMGFKVVHRHLLEPSGDGGTVVRSEESMAGPLLGLLFSEAKLRGALEKWLTALKAAAEKGAVRPQS
jgi:uncharacterized protein YndB with AHSA1/START domain